MEKRIEDKLIDRAVDRGGGLRTVGVEKGTGIFTAHRNGRVDYVTCFSIICWKLFLDPTPPKPDLTHSGNRENCLIVEKEDGVWLYNLQNRSDNGCWLALKLIPAE